MMPLIEDSLYSSVIRSTALPVPANCYCRYILAHVQLPTDALVLLPIFMKSHNLVPTYAGEGSPCGAMLH